MPVYRYTAIAARVGGSFDGSGAAQSPGAGAGAGATVTKGTLAADSDQHLRAALRGMGLQPLSVRALRHAPSAARRATGRVGGVERKNTSGVADGQDAPPRTETDESEQREIAPRRRFAVFASLARRRRSGALVEFYESLATLLASGAPLASSLDLLGPRASPTRPPGGPAHARGAGVRVRRLTQLCAVAVGRRAERRLETVSLSLAERVRSGASLADALADHPGWFGEVDRALVASCERSGHAEKALADLADLHARGEDLRGRLVGALAYPALLLIFGLGVVVFLTTTTLPQLAGVLEDAGAEIPPATAALLGLGGLLTRQWPLAVALVVALLAGLTYAGRSQRLARARLAVPLLGRASLRGQTSSAALLLARLLDAGVPLSEAIELVAPSVPNQALRGELLALRESLVSGRSLSERATAGGLIEPVFCRVLEVAEESGEMASALRTIGLRQRDSARRLIDRLASTLEPVVILALACGIGFVVYASIAPMLRVAQTL